jgi:hypothetical protein
LVAYTTLCDGSPGIQFAVSVFATFVPQREVFKHFDEDSRPREDKIIHNKLTKPRRENISQQGRKGRKDGPFEFLKSVFVAFAILL